MNTADTDASGCALIKKLKIQDSRIKINVAIAARSGQKKLKAYNELDNGWTLTTGTKPVVA